MAESVHTTTARKKTVKSQDTGVKPVEWVDLERVDDAMEKLSHETRELYKLMTPAFGTSERIKSRIAHIETGLADVRAAMKVQQDVVTNLQQAMQRQGLLDTSSTSAGGAHAPQASNACLADVQADFLHGLTQHVMKFSTSLPQSLPLEAKTCTPGAARIVDGAMQVGSKRKFSQTQPEFMDPMCDANVAKLRKVLVKTDDPNDYVLVSDLCTSVFDNKLSQKRVSELLAIVVESSRIALIDIHEQYVSSSNPNAAPKSIVVGKKHGKRGWVLNAEVLAAMREEEKAKDL